MLQKALRGNRRAVEAIAICSWTVCCDTGSGSIDQPCQGYGIRITTLLPPCDAARTPPCAEQSAATGCASLNMHGGIQLAREYTYGAPKENAPPKSHPFKVMYRMPLSRHCQGSLHWNDFLNIHPSEKPPAERCDHAGARAVQRLILRVPGGALALRLPGNAHRAPADRTQARPEDAKLGRHAPLGF